MRAFRAVSRLSQGLFALALASSLNACLLDPDAGRVPQTSRTSQGPARDGAAGAGARLSIRAVLPESAVGKVDSAELRVRTAAGKVSAWPMAVSDSGLAAEIGPPEAGRADLEVVAFSSGRVAFAGSLSLDASRDGFATVTVALGEIGRVRIEAVFEGEGLD